jgi:hypothetical protein
MALVGFLYLVLFLNEPCSILGRLFSKCSGYGWGGGREAIGNATGIPPTPPKNKIYFENNFKKRVDIQDETC